jgi:metal-sulfur cluster biosynthetic enzyme
MMDEVKTIWSLLALVEDPEVPALSVVDLGIVRDVRMLEDGRAEVVITPTYSGCPAMDLIRIRIRMELIQGGLDERKGKGEAQGIWDSPTPTLAAGVQDRHVPAE